MSWQHPNDRSRFVRDAMQGVAGMLLMSMLLATSNATGGERNVQKWNQNPYLPDSGGDGRQEDDGAAWLLPYWMARYHGFIAPEG